MNTNNKKLVKTVLQCDALEAPEFNTLVKISTVIEARKGESVALPKQGERLVILLSGVLQQTGAGYQIQLAGPVLCNSLTIAQICTDHFQAVTDISLLEVDRAALQRWLAGSVRTAALAAVLMQLEALRQKVSVQAKQHETVRREKDLLGVREVPQSALFGVQTLRAQENFAITGIKLKHFPQLVNALAMVKKAAAKANNKLGQLDNVRTAAICQACDEIVEGQWHEHFVVDVIQGGAGTSTNMNANEVIANRGLEILGHARGDYQHLHPNNHVNLSQSTNDAYPTAIRLSILLSHQEYVSALSGLCYQLKQKAVEFSDVIKMGRTQLQDAVPITLGQEFDAWYSTIKEDIEEAKSVVEFFREINMGATAIGTGINTDPEYSSLVIEELCHISEKEMIRAGNLIEATSDMGAFVTFSSVLKRNAVKLSKMCNDLRLLSSGPRAGLQEINLPPMQPGSSIMPGKVNPVIPEMVNQVAFQVIGNDIAVTMAAEAGQLQLNVMEPVIAFNVLQSLRLQVRAVNTLADKCIKGISANRDHCLDVVNNSIGIITALNPYIGYENATRIAQLAIENNNSVRELVLKEGLLTGDELDDILSVENMTAPRRMRKSAVNSNAV
ncbi:aspartate ammonia-lyase [Amphritea balenae]|uniref:Aspartate ammonia-lyase n=1 Tax=Amphritea balenae TaxID=452629 RepID=A0A3P1SZL2_9GAMM|nr:aspartate ammonia-lyase [Amphritea balenae]GGK55810.1 aspartate ammonia-lyase [Amphritea balenae]